MRMRGCHFPVTEAGPAGRQAQIDRNTPESGTAPVRDEKTERGNHPVPTINQLVKFGRKAQRRKMNTEIFSPQYPGTKLRICRSAWV